MQSKLINITNDVDRLTAEVFANNDALLLEKTQYCQREELTNESKTVKRPLPAPRFSKRNAKKPLITSKQAKQKPSKLFLDREESTPQSTERFIYPVYNEFELNLMEQIEKEFGFES